MKLLSKLFLGFMLFSVSVSIPYGANAEETIVKADEVSEKVKFNSLPDEERTYLSSQGFSEEQEYQQTTIIEMPLKAGVRSLNVINYTAGTKKVNATTGYTIYVITASKAGFLELNTQLTYGTSKKRSTVVPYSAPKSYGGGIYFSYTGKKKYFACSAITQFWTRMGTGTASAKAGGVTLGK
ncbi:hypothetical protein A6I69_12615 [Listeria monocytogenes]|nr:hypothetical protein [Listeria monocytogenes]